MLMAGIAVFSVPTPEFGPAILATPLWALMLLHYWLARGAGRRGLLGRARRRGGAAAAHHLCRADPDRAAVLSIRWRRALGRAQLDTVGPWIAGVAMTAVLFPYLIWLDLSAGISFLDLATIVAQSAHLGLAASLALLLSHAGMADPDRARARRMVALARHAAGDHPRAGRRLAARGFVYFFALAPIVAMGLFALFTRRPENFLAAPLVVHVGARRDRCGRRADQDRAPVSDRLCVGRR